MRSCPRPLSMQPSSRTAARMRSHLASLALSRPRTTRETHERGTPARRARSTWATRRWARTPPHEQAWGGARPAGAAPGSRGAAQASVTGAPVAAAFCAASMIRMVGIASAKGTVTSPLPTTAARNSWISPMRFSP